MHKICPRHIQNIIKIHKMYAQNIHKIYAKAIQQYAKYMPHIPPRYAKDMNKI